MTQDKSVDENWKESAAKAKSQTEVGSEAADQSSQIPEVNFLNYISSLALQTVIFLGDIPNPMTNQTEKNLDQAKFLIDTLVMIREKTQGNLNEQEEGMVSTAIYELQTKFIAVQQQDQQ